MFPGLPYFYLLFAVTIIHRSGRPVKNGEGLYRSIHHMSGREVDIGGEGRYSNMYVLNLKVSFLLVKTSSFNHTNVWSTKL